MQRISIKYNSVLLHITNYTASRWTLKEKKQIEQAVERFYSFFGKKQKSAFRKLFLSTLEINLYICGKKRIHRLNKLYLKKDRPTDVLSFPVYDSMLYSNNMPSIPHVVLGDIYICNDVAVKQAQDLRVSVPEELARLFIHGLLHLMGFDHELGEKEAKEMEKIELQILQQ